MLQEWGRGAVKSDKDRKKRKKRARFYRDDVMTESEVSNAVSWFQFFGGLGVGGGGGGGN